MNRVSAKIILFIAALMLLSSCDIIEPPYRETAVELKDTVENIRKVLLEDYTGMRCGNCPEAAEIAKSLHDIYGDKLIIMGVHAGGFALPLGEYTYDFRNVIGNTLNDFFGISKVGNPNGMVNRKGYPGKSHVLSPSQWENAVRSYMNYPADLSIELTTDYNDETFEISVTAELEYHKNGSPSHHLAVYIVEDSIVKMQTDYRKTPKDIPDYVHNHVLRAGITDTWGEQVKAGTITKGDKITKEFKFTIPENSDWRANKLKIIAFVQDHENSYEILQAEETELMK